MVGYIPYLARGSGSTCAWMARALAIDVEVLEFPRSMNLNIAIDLPQRSRIADVIRPFLGLPWVVVEGPGGLMWASLLRASGFEGGITAVAHVNPTSWHDVKAIALFRRFLRSFDRLYVGSTPSADLYRRLGLSGYVGYPFGIDSESFSIRDDCEQVCRLLGVPPGRMLVFAGRLKGDKSIHRLLRVALKAQLLFPDLTLVIASSVVDSDYAAQLVHAIDGERVMLVRDPTARQLAALFGAADAFITAATSEYETLGRAPIEAMACGAPAIAPRYDGFCETLAQPGGIVVDVAVIDDDVAVDETALLRAIYDLLSAGGRAPRETISSIARARFSRDTTISMLSHLRTPPTDEQGPSLTAPTLGFPLPTGWSNALNVMRELTPGEAVDWALAWRDTLGLCDHDTAFQRSVRRHLAGVPT